MFTYNVLYISRYHLHLSINGFIFSATCSFICCFTFNSSSFPIGKEFKNLLYYPEVYFLLSPGLRATKSTEVPKFVKMIAMM